MWAVGYRPHEVTMPDAVPLNAKAKIRDYGISAQSKVLLARTLGPYVQGLLPPMADAMDQQTLLDGAKYRFARAHQAPHPVLVKELTLFTRAFIHRLLKPIPAGSVSTIDYIEQMQKPRAYKDHLLELHSRNKGREPLIKTYKSFGKVERFKAGDKYKHVRCINPPPDLYKIFASPLIHEVEKIVCKLPWFAKYIPVAERAKCIIDMFAPVGSAVFFYQVKRMIRGFWEVIF